ncbi:hypothetical protein ACQPZG_31970 [Streptomyces sp. CA-294286]|uniref:hypothetical protein n=1 Tax=Streptomyces sp. CA-294286 TaxID=3240070 RepID=UPI003D9317E3
MAPRIRTIKPEIVLSEDLASVSLTAERTFVGLLTQADDSGRYRAHPAIIAGQLWSLRPEHTATHVAMDLEQLDDAGLICRYTGCDGRLYLHIVTWARHQRIDRPSASRFPRCPRHQAAAACGGCSSEQCPQPSKYARPQDSSSLPGGLDRPVSASTSAAASEDVADSSSPAASADESGRPVSRPHLVAVKPAGQMPIDEGSSQPREDLPEPSSPGSWSLDLGSSLTGGETPPPDASLSEVSANELLREYVKACAERPPKRVLDHLGREAKQLLGEGFAPATVRAAMDQLRAKGLHPSTLASLVNELVNATPSSASGAGPWASTRPAHTPYRNTTAPAPTTFGVTL